MLGLRVWESTEASERGDKRDVSVHDPAFLGVVESATDDEMNLKHRLGCQGLRVGVGGSERRLVQVFEMGASQLADLFACDRVEAFINDRVVPLPLLGDITLYD